MPREKGDRPDVVPEGAVNFAFLGQFAETARDTIFTTEYSIRTGMEAVYTLLNIDRGVPEVWGSVYDVTGSVKCDRSNTRWQKDHGYEAWTEREDRNEGAFKGGRRNRCRETSPGTWSDIEKNRIINITNALAEVWFARAFLGLYDNVQAEGLPHGRFLCFGCV